MNNILFVEGWRNITHSYAMVNQWQLLSFLEKRFFDIKFIDAPYLHSSWMPAGGLFTEKQEAKIRLLERPRKNEKPIAKYRINYPLDFSCSGDYPHFIFGTSEGKKLFLNQSQDHARNESISKDNIYIVTPSL